MMSTYQECGAGSLVKHLKFVGLIAQYIYYDSKLLGPDVYFAKGRLISKWFFGVIDFLQKTNDRIRLYYYDTSVRLVFVRFLGEFEDTKKTF